jgi:Na+/phosphate symporter
MVVIALVPLVVCVVGALLYALSSNPKISEMGRLAFFAGLLALMLAMAGHTVKIG